MGFCFQTPSHECSGLQHRSSDMDYAALAMWKHVELSTTGGFRPGAPSLFCLFVSVVSLRFLRFFDFFNTSLSHFSSQFGPQFFNFSKPVCAAVGSPICSSQNDKNMHRVASLLAQGSDVGHLK